MSNLRIDNLLNYLRKNPEILAYPKDKYNPITKKKENVSIEQISDFLKYNPKANLKKIINYLEIDEPIEIISLSDCPYNIIGCPKSTDLDIIFLIDDPLIFEKLKSKPPLAKLDINLIKHRLINDQYEVSERELDINLITLNEKENISNSLKGGKSTQNIIFYTYGFHEQVYPCFMKSSIPECIDSRIEDLMKFSLDWLNDLLGKEEYSLIRDEKIELYSNYTERRYNFVIQQLQRVQFFPVMEDDHKRISILKSLTMKLIQLILIKYSNCCYIKEEMAYAIDKIIPNSVESAKYLLFRGKEGVWNEKSINNFYQLLVTRIENIIIEIDTKLQWNHFSLALWPNPTKLPDLVYQEFLKSPGHHTDKSSGKPTLEFIEQMKKIASMETFGQLFILPSSNIKLLPEILQDRCLKEDQRSPEWKELMLFYQCGNSTVLEKPPINICWVEYYYNLIRGCIIEFLIINNTDFKEIIGVSIKKVSIGLIVKQRDLKNSPGCAPDLILITEDQEIIPVEIKSIISKPINNKDYRRDKHLATLQIKKAIELINLENCKKGLIIFVYIYQLKDEDRVIFDSQFTFYSPN